MTHWRCTCAPTCVNPANSLTSFPVMFTTSRTPWGPITSAYGPRSIPSKELSWPPALRETASRFSGQASLLGAALAYYAVFSLGPLMVIAIAIAGFAFGDAAARGEVSAQLKNLLGNTGAQAVEAMLAGADRHHNGLVAATIGVGTLLVAAVWVVVAFKEALNTIWDVAAAPTAGIWP